MSLENWTISAISMKSGCAFRKLMTSSSTSGRRFGLLAAGTERVPQRPVGSLASRALLRGREPEFHHRRLRGVIPDIGAGPVSFPSAVSCYLKPEALLV